METRVCSKCSKELTIDNYYTVKAKNGSVYTYRYCKKCHYKVTKPIRKQWVKDHPEQALVLQTRATKHHLQKQVGGVYLIQTNKGLYVGSSDHIPYRISQHKTMKAFGVETTKNAKILTWSVLEEINDYELRLEREKYWIKKLQPELNIRLKK